MVMERGKACAIVIDAMLCSRLERLRSENERSVNQQANVTVYVNFRPFFIPAPPLCYTNPHTPDPLEQESP